MFILKKLGGWALAALALFAAIATFGYAKKREGRQEVLDEQAAETAEAVEAIDELADDYDSATQEEKDARFDRWRRKD